MVAAVRHFDPVEFLLQAVKGVIANLFACTHLEYLLARRLKGSLVGRAVR